MSQNITITIDTSNAAFDDNQGAHEIARILRELADSYDANGLQFHKLYDINGNPVGYVGRSN